ncbi:MAG: transglycosylase domain-containing protein [Anaeroplasma sp.]
MKKFILFFLCFTIISFFLIIININPAVNAKIIIEDSDNNEISYVNNQHYSNSISLDDLKPEYVDYILTIEDSNFYNHHGFDIKRIFASIYYNLTNDDTIGGSTITQQYIKNTYLSNKKTISRKIKEIILAIKIENKLSKKEILEEYLSSIYFGNNVYGLSNASKYYFNKELTDLTDLEMVSLIALWNSPSIYSNSIEKWNQKKNKIVKKLYKENIIENSQYIALLQNINLRINKEYIPSSRLYYLDQVINEFNQKGINAKFNETILIKTNYKKELETINEATTNDYSYIVYDEHGYIVNCVGGRNYYDNSFNIAINGSRDIGSTIKPILYYEAIKCGFENKTFVSSPYTFIYNKDSILVKNNSGNYYGNINMKTAIAVSDNIYAMKMHLTLGMNTLARHLKKYGIKAKPIPSLALGSVGISLQKLCNIYTQFFTEGNYIDTLFIKQINYNNKFYNYLPKTKELNNKTICKKIDDLLSLPFDSTIKNSTCGSLSKYLPTSYRGKTGSTSYDSYIISYSDKYLIGVWSGDINGNVYNDSNGLSKSLFIKIANKL